MPKELKYKKGFTWRHHFEEKWDRLDYSFKLKIQAFFLSSLLGLVFWGWCGRIKKMRRPS